MMIVLSRRVLFLFVCALTWVASAAAQAPPGYYDSVDASTPAALRATLHDTIDDHQRFPYTSSATDTWDILEIADENPDNASHILDVYKNASYAKVGGGNSNYNREHVWAKSYGFPNDNSSNYPYTDCHHLFLCDSGYNSSRSNKPFRDCSASCSEKVTDANAGQGGGSGIHPGNSNWTSGSFTAGTWETWGQRKGDVARALFYMDVRYEGGTHGGTGVTEPDLILTDSEALIASSNTGSNENIGYMGMLSVLVQWHLDDPVDDIERQHNDAVFAFQGNRNPFVDHPEWVSCVFDNTCSGPPVWNIAWINELHYDNVSGDVGEGFEIAGSAGLDLTGWMVEAYNGNGGGVYDTVMLGGTLADQQGGFGTAWFNLPGLQNGAPDGIALIDDQGAVVQFSSYEGSFTATGGAASGMVSVDIGVAESNSTTQVGESLQLSGSGSSYGDFSWVAPALETPGLPNNGQTFGSGGADVTPPAAPTGFTATAGNAQVDLDWADNTETDLAGYNLYRSTSSGGSYSVLNGSLLVTSAFSDATVTNGTTYYYVVTAVDASGNESAYSSEVSGAPTAPPPAVWINEIHYDDKGKDGNEGVEIAGTAGVSLSGWQLVAYNGNGGGSYKTTSLSGTLANQAGGFGTKWFGISGLQNGAPDGVALVDDQGAVVQFLSYEGSFTASNGPAAGLNSVDIGVQETSSTSNGHSLQLTGSGSAYADFSWSGPSSHSRGAPNSGQTLGS